MPDDLISLEAAGHGEAHKVDPITLAVVRGALETAQREMTLTMERTGRSSVLTVSRDFSNAIFNWAPEMIVQGQDLPIHLGSLILATKAVAAYFADDLRPGDVMFHNDPMYDGSHIADWCMYKPVFVDDELLFWAVSKGHMADSGGPVPGSYNPEAREIFAEGLRIPPIKIHDGGRERSDVLNLLLTNTRTRRNQAGDLRAQLGAVNVGAAHLMSLARKYGIAEVKACVTELLGLAEQQMRRRISELPDGTFSGSRHVEDVGHGLGDQEIRVTITIDGDQLRVALQAPEQIPFYTNSYRANTTSAVYLGLIMFLQPEAPFNEGMYRPIEIDYGPPGSMVNAVEPAPHVACTTCPAETITDAVRDTLSIAFPDRSVAGWGHCSAVNCSGKDPRDGREYVHMMVSSLMCGAGAVGGVMDGWHGVGPQAGLGGGAAGDMELIEYQYPLLVHRYGFAEDSGGPGEWRGGCGLVHEVEALDHHMTTIVWGEGRKYPASSVNGAQPMWPQEKVGWVEVVRKNGLIEKVPQNSVLMLEPGERFITRSAGGGGVGDPLKRPPEKVLADVVEGFVSLEGAREEYGVVIDASSLAIDMEATERLRRDRT
jgi:N-methylhydantoinase B